MYGCLETGSGIHYVVKDDLYFLSAEITGSSPIFMTGSRPALWKLWKFLTTWSLDDRFNFLRWVQLHEVTLVLA